MENWHPVTGPFGTLAPFKGCTCIWETSCWSQGLMWVVDAKICFTKKWRHVCFKDTVSWKVSYCCFLAAEMLLCHVVPWVLTSCLGCGMISDATGWYGVIWNYMERIYTLLIRSNIIWFISMVTPWKFNSSPLKNYRAPKGKACLPTIQFSGGGGWNFHGLCMVTLVSGCVVFLCFSRQSCQHLETA